MTTSIMAEALSSKHGDLRQLIKVEHMYAVEVDEVKVECEGNVSSLLMENNFESVEQFCNIYDLDPKIITDTLNDESLNIPPPQPSSEISDDNLQNVTPDKIWNGLSTNLEVGLTFSSRSDVRKFIKLYGEKNETKFVVSAGGASDGSKSRQVCIRYS